MKDAEYMSRAASLGCAICRRLGWGASPAELHHPRAGVGMAERAPDDQVIPLCPEHHRGATGIHGLGTKRFVRVYGISEPDLAAETRALVQQQEGPLPL